MKNKCKDCNKSLEDCTCIEDTINIKKEKEKITLKDCTLVLLASLPNGDVHHVKIDNVWLENAINNYGKFEIYENKIDSLIINKKL